MNKLKSILLDDEAEALRRMELLLEKFPAIQNLGSFTDPKEAITAILQHEPDILFVDIQMPELTGFEVVKQLHTSGARPFIVFVTAFDQFAIKAIKAGAFDYLLKPVDSEELAGTIEKIHRNRQEQNLEQRIGQLENEYKTNRKICFNTRSAHILLHPDEIFYLEADANYSEIFLVNNKREVVSMSLGVIQKVLPRQFLRISRSIIINSKYLKRVMGKNRKCLLKADNYERIFDVPEKQMAQLKNILKLTILYY